MRIARTRCGGCYKVLNFDADSTYAHKVICANCYKKFMDGEVMNFHFYSEEPEPPIKRTEEQPAHQPFYAKFLK